jgi:hopanoid biosynthesis associated protein HpnK
MKGRRLIVNADDFGLSEAVNEGIVEAHRRGIVTSTSLIASGAAFEDAVRLAQAIGTLDVGVHLTLTEEEPVSDRSDVPSLLDGDGRFHPHTASFVKHYFAGRISLDEVERELDAQIARVVSNGVHVSHLDGHQHVHMVPGIRRVASRLADKYCIPAIRFPKELPRRYMVRERNSTSRLLQLLALNAFCTAADIRGTTRPDHFVGFFYGGRLNKPNLMRVLETLPDEGTCELMCHPGRQDVRSARAHWQYQWQEELDALTDRDVRAWLQAHGIELVSYATLARNRGTTL